MVWLGFAWSGLQYVFNSAPILSNITECDLMLMSNVSLSFDVEFDT